MEVTGNAPLCSSHRSTQPTGHIARYPNWNYFDVSITGGLVARVIEPDGMGRNPLPWLECICDSRHIIASSA